MQQIKRIAFYIIWHLSSGMIITYGIAYVLCRFHFTCVSRAFPFLMQVSCVLVLISFLIHWLLRGWKNAMSWGTSWRILLIFAGVLAVIQIPQSLFIFVLLVFECFLLLRLERSWDRQLEDKPKRKNDEA